MLANEEAWRSADEVRSGLLTIWQAMKDCVLRGLEQTGHLPGGLKVARRAPTLFRKLKHRTEKDNLDQLDWINLYALAVNEENAAGGRVVTAPDQWRGRCDSVGASIIIDGSCPGCRRGRGNRISPHRRSGWPAVQGKCVDLGGRSGLPG